MIKIIIRIILKGLILYSAQKEDNLQRLFIWLSFMKTIFVICERKAVRCIL